MSVTDDVLSAVDGPGQRNGMQTGMSAKQRLEMAMRQADGSDPGKIPEPTRFSRQSMGVPNPYGRGLRAFEPNNVIFNAYAQAAGEADASKALEDAAAPAAIKIPGVESVLGDATGKVGGAVQAAMALAQRAVPYVWGGVGPNGVDCSGLIAYAFRAAGIDMPRYRAVDYGRMGVAVSAQDARPGDIIYYDNPGDVDHVGLYIGNGLMVQAPQTGDHVRVTAIGRPTSIRRIYDDGAFGQVATPAGGVTVAYNGRVFTPASNAPVTPATGVPGSTIVRGNIGPSKAI